jgi:hypothetical protein
VVFGHTIAGQIFGEWGQVWQRDELIGVDTGAYLTGVLSAVELPSRQVYQVGEFRLPAKARSRREEPAEAPKKRKWFGLFG